jgi:hypothetical protein
MAVTRKNPDLDADGIEESGRRDCGQRVMQIPASVNDSDDAIDEHDFHRRRRRDRPGHRLGALTNGTG